MHDVVLRDARIVRPEGIVAADVAIAGGGIAEIGDVCSGSAEELDCRGAFLLPGLVDLHVHLREPGAPWKETWRTGTGAAAVGGVTTVCDMPNSQPATVDATSVRLKADLARAGAIVDWALFVGATRDNAEDLARLEEDATLPICGVKLFVGASTGTLLVREQAAIARHFALGRRRIALHAEAEDRLEEAERAHAGPSTARDHGALRPREAATEAVALAISLAERHERPVHVCHASTAEELAMVRSARRDLVSVEVAPHHFALCDEDLAWLGNLGRVNPPLRSRRDTEVLRDALGRREVDAVATDHAPHTLVEKAAPYRRAPSGLPGLETSLRLLLREVDTRRLRLEDVAWLGAERPAALFGLTRKGRIATGSDADLVLWRPGPAVVLRREVLQTRCGWSPYEGWALPPPPLAVWVRGRLVVREGRLVDATPRGLPATGRC